MTSPFTKILAYSKYLFLFTLIALMSCNSKNTSKVTNIDDSIKIEDKNSITITKSQFSSGNMAVGTLTSQKFNTVVKTNGMFTIPPENQVDVSAYFSGYVKEIKLLPGELVKKGTVLFTIENPEYIQIQQDFLEAKGRLNYLKLDYERQKELMVDNVTSKKNYLKAELEYQVTLAKYQALKKKLSLMNINSNTLTGTNITSVISVLAPITGFATTINATKGMYLNPSDIAITVTNTDNLHIELQIFEKDLPLVQVGQPIHIKLQSDSNKVYKGIVHLINKTIDVTTRTINIHGDLVNKNEATLFAPGMYIEGDIITTTNEHLALPTEAVANIDNAYFVLVKQNDTTFKRVPVKIGASNNTFIEILNSADFNSNTEFLTKGAFNLITD